ncbi:serine/threonine protein kinase [Nocardiopsis sp. Huas11]|uniref:protein kinase domain-containing protein n=1 Tax=Nocardiopsis sp. Huas11 TaxID=2183912 RepID=UPI000EAEC3F4|nr:serine/threonine-protein kinase [Nocardiopsis sp. Huas11]RKS07896.1 serine/threonine protein kinase [Nocardiopsis sp. Huas11]
MEETTRTVGGFRLTRSLGRGGFGEVFLGERPDGTRAAVKLLHAAWAEDTDMRRRFTAEVDQARRVSGFCIAAILDADPEAERPWIATEYIEGPTLTKAVAEKGPRTGSALLRLAVSTATALAAIHAAGVVHRDLKPDNIMLAPDGPRVIDFGIARAVEATSVTASGVIGTVGYMAPEQLEGARLTPAVDLFAWGSVMVFAATAHEAFPGPTQASRIARILSSEPDTGGVPEPLATVVRVCLDKDPERRPDAAALMDHLVTGRPLAIGGPGIPPTRAYTRFATPEETQDAAHTGTPHTSEHAGPPRTSEHAVPPPGPGDGYTGPPYTSGPGPVPPVSPPTGAPYTSGHAGTPYTSGPVPADPGDGYTGPPYTSGHASPPRTSEHAVPPPDPGDGYTGTPYTPGPGAAPPVSHPTGTPHTSGRVPPDLGVGYTGAPYTSGQAVPPDPGAGFAGSASEPGASAHGAAPTYRFAGRAYADAGELAAAMQRDWTQAASVFGDPTERAALDWWVGHDLRVTLADRSPFQRGVVDVNLAVASFVAQLRPDLPPVFRGRDASPAGLRALFRDTRPSAPGDRTAHERLLLARPAVIRLMAAHRAPDADALRVLADDLEAAVRAGAGLWQENDPSGRTDPVLTLAFLLHPELVVQPDPGDRPGRAEWARALWARVEGATGAARAGYAAAAFGLLRRP